MADDVEPAAPTSNETDQALSRTSRSWRKYALPSHWPPWAAYVPYRAYKTVLKNSRYMRNRWEDRPQTALLNKTRSIPQTFLYEPLSSPDYIRLLHVRPGQDEEPLSCYVVPDYDLSSMPTYCAISYSWVGDSGFATVTCDDQELTIQTTIYQLLKRLRETDRTIVLWIDAICINQTDIAERNAQVQMMGRIYSSAERVIVWVGEEGKNTQSLADILEQVARMDQLGDRNPDNLSWALSPGWSELVQFLRRPFFTRTWVLQEVCLARRCELRYGSRVWEWSSLQRVFHYLATTGDVNSMDVCQILCGGVFAFCWNWRKYQVGPPVDLLELLQSSRDTFTSQPADKIYALLSLAGGTSQFKVDYRRDPREVFIDVASRFVVDHPDIILHYASDNIWNNVRGLPSWVPDWTRARVMGNSYDDFQESGSTKVTAMKQESRARAVKVKGRVLLIEMLEIDEVRVVGLPWPGCQQIEKDVALNPDARDLGYKALARLEEWQRMLEQLEENAGVTYAPTGESRTVAFMRTLVTGLVKESHLEEPYSSWEQVFAELKARVRRLHDQGSESFYNNPVNRNRLMSASHWALRTICERKTFFLTKKGRMGLGPAFMLPFDRIYARRRVYPPMVVRKTTGSKYRLIGECYLHGWNRSELMENVGGCIMIE